MSMYTKFLLTMVLAVNMGLYAQAGPTWVPQGNLPYARVIKDIYEIPGTDIVIAVGQRADGSHEEPSIWRSTDGGHTWSWWGWNFPNHGDDEAIWYTFHQISYDTSRNILLSTCGGGAGDWQPRTVWYSNDYGESWHYVNHPYYLVGDGDAASSVILNGKLYVIYEKLIGGTFYDSPILLALDYYDPNPDNWTWYFVRQYPQLDINGTHSTFWGVLAVKDGKLYVVGKDKNTDAIRIYTYEPSKLEATMQRIGTVAEMREYWEKLKDGLSNETPSDSTSAISGPTTP